MATYKPSFVDISGLSQGLTRGLEIAAERKRQADATDEAKVNDFLKMYQPGKLRERDIPDFTSAYNNYKQTALNFSKLNRGGGKPEELAVAKANMDKSLGELNSIYSNSALASNKEAEFAEAIKYARNKGLSIPNEMSAIYDNLSRTSVSKLDVNKIPSAANFNLMSEDIDYTKLFKDLDLVGAKATQSKQFVDNPNSGYTFMNKPLSSRTIVTTETRNPLAMAKALRTITADPTHNGVKLQMNRQFNILKNSDEDTKSQVVNSLKPIFNVNSVDEITPEMLFAYNLSTPSIVKQEDDPKFIENQIAEIKLKTQLSEKAKDRAAKGTSSQDVGFVDVYSDIKDILATSDVKTGAPVQNLNLTGQNAIVSLAKNATGLNIGSQDLYIKEEDGEPTLFSSIEILDNVGNVKLKPNQAIGKIPSTGVNVEASGKVSAKSKTSAFKAGAQKKTQGKKTIKGF